MFLSSNGCCCGQQLSDHVCYSSNRCLEEMNFLFDIVLKVSCWLDVSWMETALLLLFSWENRKMLHLGSTVKYQYKKCLSQSVCQRRSVNDFLEGSDVSFSATPFPFNFLLYICSWAEEVQEVQEFRGRLTWLVRLRFCVTSRQARSVNFDILMLIYDGIKL